MFDGDHVRRQSMGSVITGSPCVRIGKHRSSAAPRSALTADDISPLPLAAKSHVIEEKPSIASTSSSHFGGEFIVKARHELLEIQSLEECIPSVENGDLPPNGKLFFIYKLQGILLILLVRPAVFTRAIPIGRSRSSTVTSNSSGADTPPLSISGDSFSGGSQSSIDLSSIDFALSNLAHTTELMSFGRVRARARGQGHRRRISQARMSRASVYETIEEELPELIESSYPDPQALLKDETISVGINNIFVVEPDATTDTVLKDDSGPDTSVLHKYYALKDEATETVTESRVVWPDTQFSMYAMQCELYSFFAAPL
jgi:serine/arginine repetitive matrix protein 2